tara:strand:- start:6013 stop:6987 length:975 start_codon:yes stop_codon:yes gene_type:complete
MTTELATKIEDKVQLSQAWEKALLENDLSALKPDERISFVKHICDKVGLEVSTKPFIYTKFNGELKLYASKGAAEQLREKHGISIEIVKAERDETNGVFWTHIKATTKDRIDEDYGWAAITNLKGDVLGNAVGKAITKGKRRVTLSMVGLGWMLPDSDHESKEDADQASGSKDLASALATPLGTESEKPKKKRARKKKEEPKKEEEFQTIEHPKVEDGNWPEMRYDEKSSEDKADDVIENVKEVFNVKEDEPEPEKEVPEIVPIPAEFIDKAMDVINKASGIETLDLLEKRIDVSVDMEDKSVKLLQELIDNRRDVITNKDRSN